MQVSLIAAQLFAALRNLGWNIFSFHMNQVDGWSGINLRYCIAIGHDFEIHIRWKAGGPKFLIWKRPIGPIKMIQKFAKKMVNSNICNNNICYY